MDESPTNLLTQARWLSMWPKGNQVGTPLMLLSFSEKELQMKNTVNFTKFRLRHVRQRKEWGIDSVSGLISYLHNLRLTWDSQNPRRRRLRTYYQEVPKYRGGHSRRGKLPATINRSVDRLRKKGVPGTIIRFPHLASAPAREVNS